MPGIISKVCNASWTKATKTSRRSLSKNYFDILKELKYHRNPESCQFFRCWIDNNTFIFQSVTSREHQMWVGWKSLPPPFVLFNHTAIRSRNASIFFRGVVISNSRIKIQLSITNLTKSNRIPLICWPSNILYDPRWEDCIWNVNFRPVPSKIVYCVYTFLHLKYLLNIVVNRCILRTMRFSSWPSKLTIILRDELSFTICHTYLLYRMDEPKTRK